MNHAKRRKLVLLLVIVALIGVWFSVFPPIRFYVDDRPANISDVPTIVLGFMPQTTQMEITSFYDVFHTKIVELLAIVRSKQVQVEEQVKNHINETAESTQTSQISQEPVSTVPQIVYRQDSDYDDLVNMYTTETTAVTTRNILKSFLKFRNEVYPTWNTLYWNQNTDYMYGYINAVDTVNKTLTMYIQVPANRDFSTKYDHVAAVTCDETNTILIASNLDILKVGANIWDTVKPQGFNIMAYCLDGSCSSIGKACILIDTTTNAVTTSE